MEMLKVGEFSPSFSGLSAQTIKYAVEHGAAKIDGFLSPRSVGRLATKGLATKPSLMVARVPELELYFSILGVDDDGPEISAKVDEVTGGKSPIHTDTDIQDGITLLMPISGQPAVFGANNGRFRPADMPGFVAKYGVGDGMVIRQSLSTVNNDFVWLDQATHVGVGPDTRMLAIIDIHTPDLMINGL